MLRGNAVADVQHLRAETEHIIIKEAQSGKREVVWTEILLQRMLHLCGVRAGAEARRALHGRDTSMPKVRKGSGDSRVRRVPGVETAHIL